MKLLFIIISVICFAGVVTAREAAADYDSVTADGRVEKSGKSPDVGTSELGFWIGDSDYDPTLIGRTKNRSLFKFNLYYARVIATRDSWALKYTAGLVPFEQIRQPRQEVVSGQAMDLPGNKVRVDGFGVTPLGLQMNFLRGHVLQPYINTTAGILYFNEKVPVSNASRINFALGLGAGFQVWFLENQSFLLGYKYYHLSNAYIVPKDPGMDSDLFYFGYTRSWGK